jgi:3-hydroxybutyryl-CoA dehydrogenase
MKVTRIGVVGCGLMGSGIAEVAALAGFEVAVVKVTAGPMEVAVRRVEGGLDRAVSKGRLSKEDRDAARARVSFSRDFESLSACDLVVESTAEAVASKKRILVDIERVVSAAAVIATNTSSLPLQQLASVLASPDRFLGLHFFSPVPAMKLVEVSRLQVTRPDVVAEVCLFVESLGKTPIQMGDDPGYIVNRLLVPYLCQAIETLEEGVARADDIDAAMKLGCGHPLGPLALSDFIGLDIVYAMAQTLSHELRDKRFKPPTLLRRLVLAGAFGKKTKLGIYDYRGPETIENADIRLSCSTPDLNAIAG